MKPSCRKQLLWGFLLCSAPSTVAFATWSSDSSLYLTAFATKPSDDDSGNEDTTSLPKDRTPRVGKESHSSNKSKSALSQPNENEVDLKRKAMSRLARPPGPRESPGQSDRGVSATGNRKDKKESTLLPRAAVGFQKQGNRKTSPIRDPAPIVGDQSFFSLLPPPITDSRYPKKSNRKDDSLSVGLSSWVDFLGPGGNNRTSKRMKQKESNGLGGFSQSSNSSVHGASNDRSSNVKKSNVNRQSAAKDDRLPSIADLFPPATSRGASNQQLRSAGDNDSRSREKTPPPPASLDGVLPVRDLFYRSSQSMSEDEDLGRDDEELPFSAEQSDRLTTGNRIRVRRNQASSTSVRASRSDQKKKSSGNLNMVRRGMEMLVGGVPINADPPQRYVDLMYSHREADIANWSDVITMDTRDFGPLLHSSSVSRVSKVERGLFCEHFVHFTSKWDVCPKDLRTIVKAFSYPGNATELTSGFNDSDIDALRLEDQTAEEDDSPERTAASYTAAGFGLLKNYSSDTKETGDSDEKFDLDASPGGELVFSIGVSREELQSADSPSEVPVLERVLAKGIAASTDCSGFNVVFTKLILTELDDGSTQITGNFRLNLKDDQSMSYGEQQSKSNRISSSLAQATDEGSMQLAMAAVAREETAWPEALRNRIVEEFLFDDDEDLSWDNNKKIEIEKSSENDEGEAQDDDVRLEYLNSERSSQLDKDNSDGPFGMPGSVEYHEDDIFLGNGNDGVFWNYAGNNADKSPFGGALGLRLVDSVTERAKQRQPRVIAIGDVHGCIDELQELLRRCDYRPGDLIVFLGDLVSKGPDSIAVVQMAREIGAIGVRGNHDFEVIRWHQAIKSGIDPPVVGSEHFQIASCLTKADMKWMYR